MIKICLNPKRQILIKTNFDKAKLLANSIINFNIRSIKYLTINIRIAFIQLRQNFFKNLIFWYFNPKYYI